MAAVTITMGKFTAGILIAILASAALLVGVFTMLVAGTAGPTGATRVRTVSYLQEASSQLGEANAREQFYSDVYEEVYWDLLYDVGNELSKSESHNFESPVAKALVEQARSDYGLAILFANQGKYDVAVSSLEGVRSYLEEAAIKEQRYIEQKNQKNQQLYSAVAIVLAISVVIAVIIFLGKRRSSQQTLKQKQVA